ncbi:S1 family peptidase [Thalassotalea sp. ND16A]|uniref:S1 family peptidase n=1 Tax=Thalassotalea sp. ND16A TaxID=1535422 RepID=UPI00051A18BB|nr:serine protease [Thalassotalea sp. ND16A]KGJ98161.1 hypothetical protein ND16A_0966 [Thalassotalea sp. ND16A]
MASSQFGVKFLFTISLLLFTTSNYASSLVETIIRVKPAIVGIGTHAPTGRPQNVLSGTGFVIGNGQYVATNYHVIANEDEPKSTNRHVIFTGSGKQGEIFQASVVARSKEHDLAILKHHGPPLLPMTLAAGGFIDEGSAVAFTGFPIGAVLGLYPVTHQGFIASITPVVIPARGAAELSASMIKLLKEPYFVYQLDATAYPGNSGSPVYDIDKGMVVAVINKVFVQKTKEAAITNPSGITYAIPIKFLHELIANSHLDIHAN